jgi:hypothetical protein
MLPDWFMKPEAIFRTVLWLVGPFFTWLVGRVILRRIEAWHVAQTEANAKVSLVSYYKALDNPPTLLESLAYIICFLPLPIFGAMLVGVLYFLPHSSQPSVYANPQLALEVRHTALAAWFFINYLVFGVVTCSAPR